VDTNPTPDNKHYKRGCLACFRSGRVTVPGMRAPQDWFVVTEKVKEELKGEEVIKGEVHSYLLCPSCDKKGYDSYGEAYETDDSFHFHHNLEVCRRVLKKAKKRMRKKTTKNGMVPVAAAMAVTDAYKALRNIEERLAALEIKCHKAKSRVKGPMCLKYCGEIPPCVEKED